MSTVKHDPENYLKMSEPYESAEKANSSLTAFYEKLSELRKEFKIPDILIVTKGLVRYSDGQVGEFIQHSQMGDMSNGVSMAAYAYGQLQSEQREMLNKLIAGKK